ncbi:envelope stress response membrane protein PspB [Sphingorhabdus sp. EL138]|jgi:phage shock protein B|uniref:envelope stress response membrane protein PspB n=1 Tax=Sphingorhabdus sp. EL138 TaxID=2073156 RepID=UPI0025F6B21F|nr:envelope stress response membrane protein PspB [Sphingorhabdus sp. EL138]
MEDVLVPIMVMGILFVALPWLVLHYVTRWKTAATLTNDDERMLGDMHELARRLEDRLDTVERLVAQENPNWQPRRMDLDAPKFDPENARKLERNR